MPGAAIAAQLSSGLLPQVPCVWVFTRPSPRGAVLAPSVTFYYVHIVLATTDYSRGVDSATADDEIDLICDQHVHTRLALRAALSMTLLLPA